MAQGERAEAVVWVAAPPARAYTAWITPAALERWFKPSADARCQVLTHDAREGGQWRVEVFLPTGETYRVGGVYLEIVPKERLRFTWTWETGGPPGFSDETTVTVRFERADQGTRISVVHDRLPRPLVPMHLEGWNAALERLDEMFDGDAHAT